MNTTTLLLLLLLLLIVAGTVVYTSMIQNEADDSVDDFFNRGHNDVLGDPNTGTVSGNSGDNTPTNISGIIVQILSSPDLYKDLAISSSIEGPGRAIIKAILFKSFRAKIAVIALKTQKFFLEMAAKVLQKIAGAKGPDFLARLGIRAGQEAAGRAAKKYLIKLGVKEGTKVGTKVGVSVASKMAAQGAVAAATGPGAPFVEAAFLVFDIISITLDVIDAAVPGGTVGYAKMGSNKEYIKIRDEISKQLEIQIKEAGSEYPVIVGPLDKLSVKEYTDKITEKIVEIFSDTNSPLVKPMIDAIIADITAGTLTESDLQNDQKMEKYINMIDADALTNKATEMLCTSLNGKIIGNQCSYPTKSSCESSYSFPLKETDNYAEFKNDKCVLASYALRGICQENGIEYDTETGTCKVDKAYCNRKGADWRDNDCYINPGQNIAELLFSTTIVRGIKQIFDPDQYETCKSGEIDDGYFCRKLTCGDGQEESQGLCYDKPRKGFSGAGSIAYANCEWGNDYGLGCTKRDSYGRGAGRFVLVGQNCNNDEERWGGPAGLCYPKCAKGFNAAACCVCSPDCPPNTTDIGATCTKNSYVRPLRGAPQTQIRMKKRAVPYSTKDN